MFYKNTRGHFEGYFYKIKEIRKSREYSTVAWEKRSGNWEIHIKRSSPAEVSATFKFSGVASWKFIAYMIDDSVVVSRSWKTGTSTMFSVHKISNFLEYIRGVWTHTNLTKTHNQKWARQGNLTSTHLQSNPQKVRQTGCQGNAEDRCFSLLEQRCLHYDILLNIVVSVAVCF